MAYRRWDKDGGNWSYQADNGEHAILRDFVASVRVMLYATRLGMDNAIYVVFFLDAEETYAGANHIVIGEVEREIATFVAKRWAERILDV